jgi:hypothetical protein
MPYESRAFWSYDWNTERYQMHWIDNHSSISTTFEGTFIDDQTLVLHATWMQEKRPVRERMRLILLSADRWQFISESDVHGDFAIGCILKAERSK